MADKPKPRGVKSMAFDGLLGHPTLTLTQRRVAWLLIKRANKGTCYPGVRRIASDLGITRREVQRALDVLCSEPLNLFRREVHSGRANANDYFPNWVALVALETASSASLKKKRTDAEKKAPIRPADATEKVTPFPPFTQPENATPFPPFGPPEKAGPESPFSPPESHENSDAKRREFSPEKAGILHVKGGNFDTKAEEFSPVSAGNVTRIFPSGKPVISKREEVILNKVANAGAGIPVQAQYAAAAPPPCQEGNGGLQRLPSVEAIVAVVGTARQPPEVEKSRPDAPAPKRPPPPLPPTIAEIEEAAAGDAQLIRFLRENLDHDAIVAIADALARQQNILDSQFALWLRDEVAMSAFAAERFVRYGRLLRDGLIERDMIPPHDERALAEYLASEASHAA